MMTKERDKIMANKKDTVAELTQELFANGIVATMVRDFIERAYDAGYNDGYNDGITHQPDIPHYPVDETFEILKEELKENE